MAARLSAGSYNARQRPLASWRARCNLLALTLLCILVSIDLEGKGAQGDQGRESGSTLSVTPPTARFPRSHAPRAPVIQPCESLSRRPQHARTKTSPQGAPGPLCIRWPPSPASPSYGLFQSLACQVLRFFFLCSIALVLEQNNKGKNRWGGEHSAIICCGYCVTARRTVAACVSASPTACLSRAFARHRTFFARRRC